MVTEDDWTPVMATDELAEGRAAKIEAFGTSLMVVRIGEAVFAVASRCTHQGAPLDRGLVKAAGSDPVVTCPAHGSVSSLVFGTVRRGPATRPVQPFVAWVVDHMVELRPRS